MSATITIAKSITPAYSDPNMHHTGSTPSTIAIGAARQSMLHAANYRKSGMICIGEKSERLLSTWHVFFPAVTPPDSGTTTRIMFAILCRDDADATSIVVTVTDDDATEKEYTRPSVVRAYASPTGYENPTGNSIYIVHDAIVDDSKSYNMIRVEVDGASVLSFTATMTPEEEQTYEGVFWTAPGSFDAGLRLLGYDRTNGINGSVDALVNSQLEVYPETRTILSASRPCLWGWACGAGRFQAEGSAAYIDFMVDSFNPYLFPRNLVRQNDPISVDICVAYRCDDGAKIKFVSQVGGDTEELTLTANTGAAPVMQIFESSLAIDPYIDQVEISVYRTATAAVEIHAIAIFERSTGPTV